MKMKVSPVAIFLVAFALETCTTSAHLCILTPVAQRGGYDISTPANKACLQMEGPCGDQPMKDPEQTFAAGEKVEWTFQQNLNHYSIGSGGYFDFHYTNKLDDTTEADWIKIGEISDYDAYHQKTQTNVTVAIPTPNVDCEHCILRFRYISNKPGEPIFHQCVDIAIEKEQFDIESDKHVSVTIVHDDEDEGDIPVSNGFPLAAFSADPLQIASGPVEQVLADPWSGQLKTIRQLPRPDIEDIVVTVDRRRKEIYLYHNTPGHRDDSLRVLDADGKTDPREIKLKDYQGRPFNFSLSAIHFDHKNDEIIGVGLVGSEKWNIRTCRINRLTGQAREIFIHSEPFEDHRDFVWSAYDAVQERVHVMMRHWRPDLTIRPHLHTIGRRMKGVTDRHVVELETTFLFSAFFVDSRSPNTVLALTPGGPEVDDGSADANWQLISIDCDKGDMTPLMDAPEEVNHISNQYGGVYWGGGVAGFENSKFVSSPDSINLHMIGYGERTPDPLHFKALAINLEEMEITVLKDLPYLHNMVLVG